MAATYDPTQVGDDRLSAVQYLRFPVQGRVPVAIGTTFGAHVQPGSPCSGQIDFLGTHCLGYLGGYQPDGTRAGMRPRVVRYAR